MNENFVMRPGDRFVARECGCAFVVDSGPNEIKDVIQAPKCCCGHEMVKEGSTEQLGNSTDLLTAANGQLSYA